LETSTQHLQHFLLASLPPADLNLFSGRLRVVSFSAPLVLGQLGAAQHAFFPHGGALSTGILLSNGRFVQTTLIGRDGVVGGLAALDDCAEHGHSEVVVDATASAIGLRDLREAASESAAIRSMLLRYQSFLLFQAQWIAACNACHTLEQRFASCLIRFQDVCARTTLPLTQDAIAQLLAVQRTSVNLVAHRMQQTGVIGIRRGHIQVLRQDLLDQAACECAQKIRLQFRALFAVSPPDLSEPRLALG